MANVRFEANTLPLTTDFVTAGLGLHGAPLVRRPQPRQAGMRFRKSHRRVVRHLVGGPAEIEAAQRCRRALSRHSLRIRPQAGRQGHMAGGLMPPPMRVIQAN